MIGIANYPSDKCGQDPSNHAKYSSFTRLPIASPVSAPTSVPTISTIIRFMDVMGVSSPYLVGPRSMSGYAPNQNCSMSNILFGGKLLVHTRDADLVDEAPFTRCRGVSHSRLVQRNWLLGRA